MAEKTELLRRVPIFAGCSERELGAIAAATADFRQDGRRGLTSEADPCAKAGARGIC
ncbi:MAG: hypothetical protein ICV67_06535 [Thermoleophilia bacterium]|nr:hypothetical protein [Thermoleophilia bacterium]